MAKHEAFSWGGRTVTYVTRPFDTKYPLELGIDYDGAKGGVLLGRTDAIKLRDMLIEALGPVKAERSVPSQAVTSKLGEPVEYHAKGNNYTIIDRSPFGLKVLDGAGVEKYNVGKYTVDALREYFDRPYVAPEPPKPTLREQFDALKIGAQFRFVGPGGGDTVRVKVSADRFYNPTMGEVLPISSHGTMPYRIEEVTDDA